MQNDVYQRAVDFHMAVVLNQAQFSKLVHEVTYTRPCGADQVFMEALGYYSSPYQYNPFNYNPLKKLLEVVVDFEHLRAIELRRRHRVVARIPGRACKPMCRPNDCPSPFAPPKIATCA